MLRQASAPLWSFFHVIVESVKVNAQRVGTVVATISSLAEAEMALKNGGFRD
jgi:hypothetical protein